MLIRRFLPVLLALGAALNPVRSQEVEARDSLVIVINVPAFRLDVLSDTLVIRSFDIAVGMRRYPTPLGTFAITEVQWNPWWYPPDSPWAEGDSVTPPGPANPMGKVKLALGGSQVLVHGTPQPASVGSAASHACIRMRNTDAVALASLLQASRQVGLSPAALDSLVREWRPTRRVLLPSAVQVHIVYEMVERREGELVFHPDVYRRGGQDVITKALTLMATAGYDTTRVDREQLEHAASEGGSSRTSVRIAQLIAPGGHSAVVAPRAPVIGNRAENTGVAYARTHSAERP